MDYDQCGQLIGQAIFKLLVDCQPANPEEASEFRGNEVDCVYHMLGSAAGMPLSPLEQGKGYLRLINYGAKIDDIAKRCGVSRTTIENGLILADAPPDVQQMIASGKVAAHVAIDLLRKNRSEASAKLHAAISKVGEGKVTNKHVQTRVPPRVTRGIVDSTKNLVASIPSETLSVIMSHDDEETDYLVTVSASSLKAVIQAHAELKE